MRFRGSSDVRDGKDIKIEPRRLPGLFLWKEVLLGAADGFVEAAVDVAHGEAGFAGELADGLFAEVLFDVCLLFVFWLAFGDVELFSAKGFLYVDGGVESVFVRYVVEQVVVVVLLHGCCWALPVQVALTGVVAVFVTKAYSVSDNLSRIMSVISSVSSSCTPQTGRAGNLALVRFSSNWWYLRISSEVR